MHTCIKPETRHWGVRLVLYRGGFRVEKTGTARRDCRPPVWRSPRGAAPDLNRNPKLEIRSSKLTKPETRSSKCFLYPKRSSRTPKPIFATAALPSGVLRGVKPQTNF